MKAKRTIRRATAWWCDERLPLGFCVQPVVEFCLACGRNYCERHWRTHDCGKKEKTK